MDFDSARFESWRPVIEIIEESVFLLIEQTMRFTDHFTVGIMDGEFGGLLLAYLIRLRLTSCVPRNLRIAMQVMRLKDAIGVLMSVSGNGADLGNRAAGEGKTSDRGTAQIAEFDALDLGSFRASDPTWMNPVYPDLPSCHASPSDVRQMFCISILRGATLAALRAASSASRTAFRGPATETTIEALPCLRLRRPLRYFTLIVWPS
jgi:hypothetical protein